MIDIEIFKIATDVGLAISLLFLGYKFVRGPSPFQAKQVTALETSLRTLIVEAERAGSSLNDELMKRQHSLEKLLEHADSSESRLSDSITRSKEIRAKVESLAPKVERVERVEKREIERPIQVQKIIEAEKPIKTKPALKPAQNVRGEVTYNIYGEPIAAGEGTSSVPVESDQTYRTLTDSIERVKDEVSVGEDSDDDLTATVEEIYDAAEQMIRAGKSLDFVIQRTRLPFEEVRRIDAMVGAERRKDDLLAPEARGAKTDPRLGVLGSMRRQVQTV